MSPAPPDAAAVVDLARRLAQAIARNGATARDVAAVAGGEIEDDGAPLGLRAHASVPGVELVSVTRRWESEEPNAAEIVLAPGLALTDIEPGLGASRPLPSRKPGDRRFILQDGGFGDDATAIVAVDDDGGVRSITVRRER